MKLLVLLGILSSLKGCCAAKHETNNFWIWNKTDFFSLNGQIWSNPSNTPIEEEVFTMPKNTTILVAVHNMEPYLIYYPNSNTISGYVGDLWNTLEETLHFKTNITARRKFINGRDLVKDGKADVFLGATVYTNQTTNMYFSHPYFRNWFHLYFKLPEGRPARYLHFKAFSDQLWLLLLLFYIFLTLMLWSTCYILKKYVYEVEQLWSVPTYFLGMVAAFFNTGYDLRLRSCSARLQLISALLFGILCYFSLSASLVANLAILDRPKLFSSLNDTFKQDTYSLCMRNITFVYDEFVDKNRNILPKFKKLVNTEKCPENMLLWENIPESICKHKVIILENRIIMGLASPLVKCQLTMVPERYFRTGNYIVYSKKFKLRKVITVMMMRIWSSGVGQKLESKWVPRHLPNFLVPNDRIRPITFSHVGDLVEIYCSLMLVCLVILGLEIIFNGILKMKNRHVVNREIVEFRRVNYRNDFIY